MPREVPRQYPPRLFDRVQAFFGLPEMPIIVADDIQAAIDMMPDLPNWSASAEDYGAVAPPFDRFFVEAVTSYPEHYARDPVALEEEIDPATRKRILVPAGTSYRGVAVYNLKTDQMRREVLGPRFQQQIKPDTHWLLALWGYQYDTTPRKFYTWPGPIFVHLDQAGRIIDDTRKFFVFTPGHGLVVMGPPDLSTPMPVVGIEQLPAHTLATLLPFSLKAIGAMHRRCEVEEISPSHQARRQAEKHEKLILHKHYVLQVKPTKITKPEDFRKIGTPAAKREGATREHGVRGHFRTYGQLGRKPLFGRIAGTFFVPAHRRGSPTYGDIDKDYRVIDE